MGDVGFPDFVLVFPAPIGSTNPGHVLFVEVKSDRKSARLTREQEAWGDALVRAGARWSVVRVPSELDAFVQTLVDLATVR
jgi:predicted Holliday junction resolvase-like endonuclease